MPLSSIGTDKSSLKTGQFPALYEELLKVGDEIITSLRESAKAKGLDASGNLIAGITFQAKIFETVYVFQLSLPNYYKWVNEGRKPGKMPPIEPIMQWMRYKGIKADVSKRRASLIKSLKTRKVKKSLRHVSQASAQRSLAFAIGKSIAKKGTIKRFGYKGSKFYSQIIPDPDKFVEQMRLRLSKAAKRDILVEIKFLEK